MASGYQGYAGYGTDEAKAKRLRSMADLLTQQSMTDRFAPVQHWTQGVGRLAEAMAANNLAGQADKAESAYGDSQKQKYAQLAQTLSGTLPGDSPAISSGAKTTFGDTGEATTTPGAMVAPAQASPQRRIFEALAASGQDPMAAYGVAQSMAPKREFSAVEFGTGGVGAFDPTTGTMNTLVQPTAKPADMPKAPETAMDGTMQWNAQTGKWEDIPGAMDRWRQLNPPKPEGSGGTLTPYQQFQIDRQMDADAAKQEETSRQKQINIASLKDGMSRVDQFLGSKGFEGLYGTSWLGPVPTMGNAKPENVMNQDELNSMAMLNQIGGEAFLAGVAKMRGTGPLSDNEGKRVMAAVQRLTDRRQDKASAMAAANEFKAAMDALVKVYEQESGGASMPGAVQTPQGQPNMLDAASQFFGSMFGGGQQRGAPPAQDDISDLLKKYGQ